MEVRKTEKKKHGVRDKLKVMQQTKGDDLCWGYIRYLTHKHTLVL